MTRKRKNVEEQAEATEEQPTERTFPKKEKQRRVPESWNQSGDDHYEEKNEKNHFARPSEEEKVQYPTELVTYLKNFVDLIDTEGKQGTILQKF